MPAFLEAKLKKQYPNNPHAVFGTLNAIGAMHGNKETARGRAMSRKHAADMKRKKPTSSQFAQLGKIAKGK